MRGQVSQHRTDIDSRYRGGQQTDAIQVIVHLLHHMYACKTLTYCNAPPRIAHTLTEALEPECTIARNSCPFKSVQPHMVQGIPLPATANKLQKKQMALILATLQQQYTHTCASISPKPEIKAHLMLAQKVGSLYRKECLKQQKTLLISHKAKYYAYHVPSGSKAPALC